MDFTHQFIEPGFDPSGPHQSSLLTDLYQLTMAQGYWAQSKVATRACFTLWFRNNPFGGGFAIAGGLEQAAGIIEGLGFTSHEIDYLRTLTAPDGRALFDEEFLVYLSNLRCTCDVEAVREGTVVFAREPLLRITGPLIECQLLETALLNAINFSTLVATKAARVCIAAGEARVSEFGLRRAQGPDGGVSASRAAYVGGCSSTSNVLAGKLYGIPVAGTNAHSWVMSFDSELEAFRAYAKVMPQDCILLVDTYDVLIGVENAITVGREMRERGENLRGIRIDSGDIAWLSHKAREMLDEAGFEDALIVASNDLDEYTIEALNAQGARVDLWGVGTKLATAYDQPALGGVYKLSAIQQQDGSWSPRMKLSEEAAKMTVPGLLDVRRYKNTDGSWAGDMVYDTLMEPEQSSERIVDVTDITRAKDLTGLEYERLLAPLFREGLYVGDGEDCTSARERAATQLAQLDPSAKRFVKPYAYPVGLEYALYARQLDLVKALKS